MITVINKTNKGLYQQLFQDVEDYLSTHTWDNQEVEEAYGEGAILQKVPVIDEETGESILEPDKITSLARLFQYMDVITEFTPLYTRLPLDEEPFFINADKRTISVPKDFAANGISVQGDEIAEILFFKINRFFDATDLNECDIYIQWKSSEVDANGDFKEGVSKPWIKDITSEPGYLVFGWPISSAITNTAGNVTFSVRFYRVDEGNNLLYSFSTLDQTVAIKPALDYDIQDIENKISSVFVDDVTNKIIERAVPSAGSAGDDVAQSPEWEEWVLPQLYSETADLNNVVEYFNPENEEDLMYYVRNLNLDSNGFSNEPLEVFSAATSEDAGIITYKWTKSVDINNDGRLVSTRRTTASNEDTFYEAVHYRIVDTTDSERDNNKTYYYNDGNKYKVVPIVSESDPTPFDRLRNEEGKDIYELVSKAVLAEPGRYGAVAKNRVGSAVSEDLKTVFVYIPKPIAPELGRDQDKKLVASTGENAVLDKPNETLVLSIPIVLKDQFGNDVTNTAGKAQYKWFYYGFNDSTAVEVEGATLDTSTLQLDVDADEGFYYVQVINNLNTETANDNSLPIRVTQSAKKAVITLDTVEEISVTAARNREGYLGISVSGLETEGVDAEAGDEVTFQWYRYNEATGNSAEDREAARIGMYADDTNGVNGDVKISDIRINGMAIADEECLSSSTRPNFKPPEGMEGTYFCVVTNTYNGTQRSVASPFYHVTP